MTDLDVAPSVASSARPGPPAARLASRRWFRWAAGVTIPLIVLLLWQFAAPLVFTPYQLPSPATVVRGAREYIFGANTGQQYSGTFLRDLWASVQRVFGGFLVGAVVGVPLGLAIGFSSTVAAFLEPSISLLRSVPGICWLPLALIWFGFGGPSAVFLVSLGSFFPILLSTVQGVRYLDRNLVRAAKTLGASDAQAVYTVALPAAIPSILNGLRIGLAYSWIYMILGEFTGVNEGLGASLLLARESLRTDIIICLMVIIGLLGALTDAPVQWLLRKAFRADVR